MKIFTHTCEICGNEFQTASNTAKYCKYCRGKAQYMRNKAYAEKKKNNETQPVGSTQKCPVCGKDFIKNTGIQKFCSDCTHAQMIKKKTVSSSQYNKENYEQVRFILPVGQRELLKEYAASVGLSVNKLLVKSIIEYQNNHPTDVPKLPDPDAPETEN